ALAVVDRGHNVTVCPYPKGPKVLRFQTPRRDAGSPWVGLAFSPDGSRLATVGDDRVAVCDARTGVLLHDLRGPTRGWPFRGVAFSPDGKRLAAAATLWFRVWDLSTGTEVLSRSFFGDENVGVLFTPDGGHVVSVGDKGELARWRTTPGASGRWLPGLGG